MKAINYYVIVDKIKEAPKKVAGLELTEKQDKEVRYVKGKVLSVGDQISVVKENDIIRYDKHAGHGIQDGENLYYVIKISDIVIVE